MTRLLQSMTLIALVVIAVPGIAMGEWVYDEPAYEFVGYNAPSASMETLLGPNIKHLSAKDAGFSFGGPTAPLRNLNVISDVYKYQSDTPLTIGTGQLGTEIVLRKGDLTFAYTLDYTAEWGGGQESSVKDFQLWRLVLDSGIFVPPEEPVSNPGPQIALYNILGGAYNTAPGFNGQSFEAYANGITGMLDDEPEVYQASYTEFSWPADHKVAPRSKAMGLIFCHDVTYMQIGVADGSTGEGGNVIASGAQVKNFPVLIPVVPEPASLLTLILGGTMLCRRKRQNR